MVHNLKNTLLYGSVCMPAYICRLTLAYKTEGCSDSNVYACVVSSALCYTSVCVCVHF